MSKPVVCLVNVTGAGGNCQRALSHTISITSRITSAIPSEIQSGLKTHHHDQSMTLHSFRTMNAKASRPVKPIPLLLFDFVLISKWNVNFVRVSPGFLCGSTRFQLGIFRGFKLVMRSGSIQHRSELLVVGNR